MIGHGGGQPRVEGLLPRAARQPVGSAPRAPRELGFDKFGRNYTRSDVLDRSSIPSDVLQIAQIQLAGLGSGCAVLKAVDTTFGVDDLLFTSKERVRC